MSAEEMPAGAQPGAASAERRSHPRVALRCPVEVTLPDGGSLRGQLVNLSASGMLVLLPAASPLGQEVRASVALPDGGPPLLLTAMGIRSDGGKPPKVGFHFILPPPEAVERIRRLIYGG